MCGRVDRSKIRRDGIELRSVGGQLLNLKPLDERFELIDLDIVAENVAVQSPVTATWRHSDFRNRRHSVASVSATVEGYLFDRRPCATDGRLQYEADFIDNNDAMTASTRFVLFSVNPFSATVRWPYRRVREHSDPF